MAVRRAGVWVVGLLVWIGARQAPPSGGVLEGVVRLQPGIAAPAVTQVENTTDPAACGRSHSLEDLVFDPKTRGIAHAIVALEDVPASRIPPPRPQRISIDNRKCRFVPHAAVLTTGSTVDMINSDPVLHTVHLYGPLDVNIALPLEGMKVPRTIDRPGMIVVKCDVHGWMQAFLRVDPHPFHAVTDGAGRFRIAGIPPGDYTISVWHEKLGHQRRRATVQASQVAEVDFALSSETK